ncbi:sodium:proton antiporter [Vibrio sp. UCD-FRSSP16_10]|uniref:iron-sulfur cluster carrier protein ApbC n=1 Tax=unclassified Vibrio TaxID=2614977 RepID=UPI0007FF1749|nr:MULTISPECIES: iron-sulfur cluster carrier protein ApbC [unclassified Vibrio]OBT08503.1 sodium:proton antiporter [Vibrio sp. UCD-FRSSP16_30]OBT18033.1 sodium:proton antiporter [Vibrio sp. UCD-FRSSP16_10]
MNDKTQQLHAWLNQFQHPLLVAEWAATQGVVTINDKQKAIDVEIPFLVESLTQALGQWISDTDAPAVWEEYTFYVSARVRPLQTKVPSSLSTIKNIIAVTSAKGGVGKSTTTANLALAIAKQGATVGVLDADVYGPSIPLMFGTVGHSLEVIDNKWMKPLEAHGVFTQSIGYLISRDDAAVWRGPMASKALMQLLKETQWPELDYLIIDMPPGTGDLQLTLSQDIPLTSALVVTTPQDLALADAIKGIAMFDKADVGVLGLVENMSYHVCSNCGSHEDIFGSGGAVKLAAEKGISVLAQLPLHLNVRRDIDQGVPSVVNPESAEQAQGYLDLAEQVVSRLFWHGKPQPERISFVEVK